LEDDNVIVDDIQEDGVGDSEDDVDGDDLMDDMERDYEARPELDRYDMEGLDEDDQRELSMTGRMQVDQQLNREERMQQIGRRPGALMHEEFDDEDEDMHNQIRQERLKMLREGGIDHGGPDSGDDPNVLDFEDVRGPLFVWLKKQDVIRYVKRQFEQFIRHYKTDEGVYLYETKIHEMCQNNKQSLEIIFSHLSLKFPTLAIWLAEEPKLMLDIINQVALDVVVEVYPDYHKIHDQIFVRVKDLPVEDKLRDLRQVHLNALIKIRGVVTKRTAVFPELKVMYFRCPQCQDLKGPLYNNNVEEEKQFLGTCIMCQCKGPFPLEDHKSVYRNYQKWTIQETPGSVPPGRVPRQKEVFILNDLVDTARPGDEVEITGIFINKFDYGANIKHGFPVFTTIIEANNVRRFGDEQVIELTDEDKAAIKKLSKEPGIAKKIFESIAPSIYGHMFIKKGLTLAMFGGVPKDIGGKHKIRGDINMLLLGDPGTAKSQFLKYVEQIFPRVVYTTGKGASAVGLTAGVHRDPVTQEWVLEAGALVLADKGVCLIDEFDKMNDADRTSIHEAMEQQSISISKAGIVTSLQARCSVIAAANPLKGTYDIAKNFNDNVDLTDPILSRFDLLAVVRDEVDEDYDDALATFVINSHMKNHPSIMSANAIVDNEGVSPEEKQKTMQETE
jgi:DNA replication licensing factor MCM2